MNSYFNKEYKSPEYLPKFSSYEAIIKEIKDGEDILDVGCAEGQLGRYLSGFSVWGIDANRDALKKAQKYYIETKIINLNEIPRDPIFNKKFDVIVFADILEHLLFPDKVLQYFKKYLKKNGRIIISLPNVALWRIRWNLLWGNFDYTDYGILDKTHLHLYTYKSGKELIKNVNLYIIKEKWAHCFFGYILHFFPFLKGLLSIHIIVVAKISSQKNKYRI